MQIISQAVLMLKAELSNAEQMSQSAFFKYSKEVTLMSPIQFQKRPRLLKAKCLMRETGENAERSAYRVGYKSTSQFSREYSRMFDGSPVQDTKIST